MTAIQRRRLRLGAAMLLGVLGLLAVPAGAVAQTSGAAKPFLDEARSAVAAGRYVDALAAHAGAIAAAPEDPSVYAQRASLLISLSQPDLAALDYRSAVKLKPEDAGLQINLCFSLAVANHDLDGALAACNAAVTIEPTNYEALSARGYVQLRRSAWAAAEKDFLAALAVNAASPNEMFGHGLATIHLGRMQEGRDEIASATLDSSGLVQSWEARGFGARGEIRPGKAVTSAGQPITSADDPKLFLNSDEVFIGPLGPCGLVAPKTLPASARVKLDGVSALGGSTCRFGLMHGERTLSEGEGDKQTIRFAYGRSIAAGAEGDTLERKLALAYQAAESALTP